MGALLLALVAGGLTTLSPCVLPVLPLILYGALDQHRLGPLALAGGLVVSFTLVGLAVFSTGSVLGLQSDTLRSVAAAFLIAFGTVLASTALQQRVAVVGAALTHSLNQGLTRFAARGLTGQFALGAILGIVWAPCSGPTLGTAVTLAAESGTFIQAGSIMLFFSVGVCIPLLALGYGSREAIRSRRAALGQISQAAKPVLGAFIVLVGALVLSGWDKSIEAAATAAMPDWLVSLTTRF